MARSLAGYLRLTVKPVYVGYYRLLYGRTFAGAGPLERTVQRLERLAAHGDTPAPKDTWEEKYRAGGWDFMRSLFEVPRYASIAAIASFLHPGGSVLDVGCGEGLLVDHLRPLGYRRYVGIDLAETAIALAAGRADGSTAFEAADAELYATDERFDVIIFNECLGYFQEPVQTVQRYESFLAPGGSFIVSTFRTPRHDAIARAVGRRYRIVEEATITHRVGASLLRVLAPNR